MHHMFSTKNNYILESQIHNREVMQEQLFDHPFTVCEERREAGLKRFWVLPEYGRKQWNGWYAENKPQTSLGAFILAEDHEFLQPMTERPHRLQHIQLSCMHPTIDHKREKYTSSCTKHFPTIHRKYPYKMLSEAALGCSDYIWGCEGLHPHCWIGQAVPYRYLLTQHLQNGPCLGQENLSSGRV